MAVLDCTMTVRVRFMGDLRSVTGQRSIELALPERSTLGDLLESLSLTYGDRFRQRIFSGPDKLQHTMVVFVDGMQIEARGALTASLGAGDVELFMLPVLCGG
jgi:hypothetical protein